MNNEEVTAASAGSSIAAGAMRTVIDLAMRRRLGRSPVAFGPLGFGGNALSNSYGTVDYARAVAVVQGSHAGVAVGNR